MKKIILDVVRFYRGHISPLLGNHCRFEPSCSGYLEQALTKKNAAHAFLLTTKRILKCHPFHPGGFDPVE